MNSKTFSTNKKYRSNVDQVRELPSDPTVDWLWGEVPNTYWDSTDEPQNEEWDIAIKDRHLP